NQAVSMNRTAIGPRTVGSKVWKFISAKRHREKGRKRSIATALGSKLERVVDSGHESAADYETGMRNLEIGANITGARARSAPICFTVRLIRGRHRRVSSQPRFLVHTPRSSSSFAFEGCSQDLGARSGLPGRAKRETLC